MAGHQTGFEFPGHNEHHFQGNMMFQNTQHSHSFEQPFQTNADIHQKAMKISQTILSSEWGHPDTSSLYKPTMYSHLASNQPVTENERQTETKQRTQRHGK
ncbi:hypothetical protein DPMN_088451 [Dreissena polymorpha]|uniref:Uncharacterized protein n=1 Tax=Dreissena polymorpha TaxID=45954 RepID=A0A9D4KV30_DREPO|nr:hypothetical protein DPMN_088451 [Dreissena polymorpha]